ncbi:stage III sporulation protein AF [Weizmannia acidilactici]|uniref:stage III sporulation protein AF n=1 Tax=Weizmannia acidilactici TaxID=2607726 RepID=UPI00124CAB80|nr:stage III sporulation protein AF [Weizmannia acidilactici]GER66141.1 stage III sporulation protein AF [Weizmannia acidilactici]GER72450.1 stage III sporulation protein AF [Weizmannia acidilactici]
MDYLTKWVLHIIIFILLTMVVDMLLPESGMRKYTKLVIGLLLITIILTPVFQLFSMNPEDIIAKFKVGGANFSNGEENALETQKKEINAMQQEYTLQQMAVQLKQDAEGEVEKQFGKSISDIKLEWKDGKGSGDMAALGNVTNVKKIKVYLAAENEKGSVAVIEPIEIGADENTEKESSTEKNSIISMLSNRWNVPKEKIELHIEGGLGNENGP